MIYSNNYDKLKSGIAYIMAIHVPFTIIAYFSFGLKSIGQKLALLPEITVFFFCGVKLIDIFFSFHKCYINMCFQVLQYQW